MASAVGKKYIITFHFLANTGATPWTFTDVIDRVDFSQTFTYDDAVLLASTSSAVKLTANPTALQRIDVTAPGVLRTGAQGGIRHPAVGPVKYLSVKVSP